MQQPTTTLAQEPHITMSVAPASDLVSAPPIPTTHSLAPTPTTPANPSLSSPPVAFIHIIAQDFLSIMAVVRNFVVTSQSFVVAQATMANRMACTEVVLAQNTAILAQVQQHLGLPPIPLIPVAAPAALAAPPAAHPSAPAQSQDEDEVPPSTTT